MNTDLILQGELAPNERVLWFHDTRDDVSRQSKVATVCCALMELALVLSGGLYMGAGISSYQRLVYAVTNQRLLIISPTWTRQVSSYEPNEIGSVVRRDKPSGRGDVIFVDLRMSL